MWPFETAEKTSEKRSLVWAGLVVAAYSTRRSRLRRAALRGLLAAAIARAFILLPPWRGRYGEEAVAGAFVTGAGLEVPIAAVPLGLLAAQLHRDDTDHVSDRLLAATAGALVAAGSAQVWPVRPRLGSTAPKVWLPERAVPAPDGDGLTVVINTDSGPEGEEPPTREIKEALPKAEVIEVDPDGGDELRKALDAAVDSGSVALGVCGGDGSINTAAQVAMEAEKALVVFPGGTFNHLTQALGVESMDAPVKALKNGEAVGVDVATIGGRVFLNTASFGSYVELVDARERLEKKVGKWPAVALALIRVLRGSEPIEVEIEGERHKIWMAFIGNCRYHPSGFAPSWRERLDDGLLDFRYVSGNAPWARTRLIAAVLTGRLGRSRVYRQTCVERLHLRSLSGPLRLASDGETFEGPEDIVVEKLEKRLALYVPHDQKA